MARGGCPILSTLILDDNAIGNTGLISICNCLLSDGMKMMTFLSLRSCCLTSDGIYCLSHTIGSSKLTHLSSLVLSNNNIESKGIKSLIDKMGKETCPSIRSLDISYNLFDETTTLQFAGLKAALPTLISIKCESIFIFYLLLK